VLQRQDIQKRLATELKTFQDTYKSKIVYAKGYGPPEFPKAPGAAPAAKPPASAATPAAAPAKPAAAAPAAAN
jgi:hypothetical protein